MAEILIHGGAVYSAEGWLEPGYVLIAGDKISRIGEGSPPEGLRGERTEVISAAGQAVLPGLVNGHTHLGQVFMRGLAGGRSLLDWLKEVVWPLQATLTQEETYLAALLGLVENLRGGVTSLVNHHKITGSPEHTDGVMAAAEKSGLRLRLARSWSDLGENAEDPSVILDDLTRLFDTWRDHPRLAVDSGPLALWRCAESTLQQAHKLARSYGRRTHFHVAETQEEVRLSEEAYGLRPVEWLHRIGVLDPETEVVHAVWVNEDELSHLAGSGALVVHCPVSNAVLGSGTAPVGRMLELGIKVALGTDGPASNDTQDLWETAKTALMLARVSGHDPRLLPPPEVLRIATGGRSLEAGGEADLILVDLGHPRLNPIQDLSSALVLGAHSSDVSWVIVNGRILLRNGRVEVLDEEALVDECRLAVRRLRKRAGLDD